MNDLGGWRQRILDELDARQVPRAPRVSVRFDETREVHGAVLVAAKLRGMSPAAYQRRAAAAFAAHDLGLSWGELMHNEPRVGVTGGRRKVSEDEKPRGRGYGPWMIVLLDEAPPWEPEAE